MLIYIKINPNFGVDLYNALHPALFYISFFMVVIALVNTMVSSEKRLIYILLQGLISAIVLFIIKSPDKILLVGEFTFDLFYSLLQDMKVEAIIQEGWIL